MSDIQATPEEDQVPATPEQPATPPDAAPVDTPTPAVSDADMANASASLEVLSNLFIGMTAARAALGQIGSFGQALSERTVKLDGINTAIATAQAQLTALQGDVARNTDQASSILSNAVAQANKATADAETDAQVRKDQAVAEAAAVRQSAVADSDAMRAASDVYANAARVATAQAQSDLTDLNARKGLLAGEVSDLETKLAVGRANLRDLLGETQ